MSEHQINILPLNILKDSVDVFFSLEENEGWSRINRDSLPSNFPDEELNQIEEYAWWTFDSVDNGFQFSIDLLKNKGFARHYIKRLIHLHFSNNPDLLINRNFIGDTEVYSKDNSFDNDQFHRFNRFTLRADNNHLIPGPSLRVSYDGDSYIFKNNLANLKINDALLNWINVGNEVLRFRDLSSTEKAQRDELYPIRNRLISNQLNIQYERTYSKNKYKKYYDHIHSFYNTHLKDVTINEAVRILGSGFHKPHAQEIYQTLEDSNLLLFGDNQKHFVPYIGIKEYGPIQGHHSDNPLKLIFIFHEDDKDYANKLYSYFKQGYKSFPGLESFVNIIFEIDQDKTIRFSSDDPISEVKNALEKFDFKSNTTYAAIYISRIKKDSDDKEEELIYYKLKELLLKNSIASQVIYKDNINNPAFNYFLPNIAIALLAKVGGIPWRLYRPIKNDLVLGVGAYIHRGTNKRFIGNAFCFKNDGSFRGFNVFEKENANLLADSIVEAIEHYISENETLDRLVIHYYKQMRWEEAKPIRAALDRLNLNIPYIVLTINETESKDYVLFDTSFDGKLPQSGTFIKTKWNEFILCNNTRYSRNTAARIDGFPFPIKIKIRSSSYEEKINFGGSKRAN